MNMNSTTIEVSNGDEITLERNKLMENLCVLEMPNESAAKFTESDGEYVDSELREWIAITVRRCTDIDIEVAIEEYSESDILYIVSSVLRYCLSEKEIPDKQRFYEDEDEGFIQLGSLNALSNE